MNSTTATATSNPIISIDGLTVKKDDRVICCLSEMTVSRGERLGVIGSNGSGKSTLLRVLSGLENQFTGDCCIATEPRERVYVHQSPFLFRGTVLHNVAYGLVARSVPRSECRMTALEWLAKLGMSDFANRQVRGLSGGEHRRVALARACVLRPKLLLLDEPLADLDLSGVECLQQMLAELRESTVLITSPTPLPPDLVERSIELRPK